MPYIPPEVVAKAREMDLLTYLKNYEPQELVHFGGNTYCIREHDSLKISKSFKIRGTYMIPKSCVIDYVLSTHYLKYRNQLSVWV